MPHKGLRCGNILFGGGAGEVGLVLTSLWNANISLWQIEGYIFGIASVVMQM